ncbi:MAG: type I 3-dehydroquinate dehydratase [Candidatus Lokiarchaeota archaeon]|nr:type I 3-dehydroquinate dehydratase [Candidatus Lokiarchaeota archaeon]
MNKNLCVSITGGTPEECMNMMSSCKGDLIEHRMDYMDQIKELENIYDVSSKPIIATCRPLKFGGLFDGQEEDRIDYLAKALSAGASYIDVELETSKLLLEAVKKNTRDTDSCLIISKHYWNSTPSELVFQEILREIEQAQPDIIKIVAAPTSLSDCLRTLELYHPTVKPEIPLIAFAMDRLGKFTRVFSLFLGAPFAYVSHDYGSEAAPGQIPQTIMRDVLEVLT